MKPAIRRSLLAFFLLATGSGTALAQVQFGVSAGSQGLNNFYLAIGDYYGVPQRQVVVVRERRVPDEELPVVFFIAQRARVSPEAVVKMRMGGKSWMDIALFYRLDPGIFYVSLNRPSGPYGHAYGYYKHHKRNEWRQYRLSDSEVVNFVNLRFLSEHYRRQPDEVAQWRSGGKRFFEINENLRMKGKPGRGGDRGDRRGDGPGRGDDDEDHDHGHHGKDKHHHH